MDARDGSNQGRRRWPLYLRITLGAGAGVALGLSIGPSPLVGGLGLGSLADLGMLVVRALKLIATPLIFFSVLDAVLSSDVRPRSAGRLFAISAVNACVALLIAVGCAQIFQSGRGQFPGLHPEPRTAAATAAEPPAAHGSGFLPESVIEPFRQNSALGVAILAVALAVALRVLRSRGSEEARQVELVATLGRTGQRACVTILGWLIELIPFAVAGVLARARGFRRCAVSPRSRGR